MDPPWALAALAGVFWLASWCLLLLHQIHGQKDQYPPQTLPERDPHEKSLQMHLLLPQMLPLFLDCGHLIGLSPASTSLLQQKKKKEEVSF